MLGPWPTLLLCGCLFAAPLPAQAGVETFLDLCLRTPDDLARREAHLASSMTEIDPAAGPRVNGPEAVERRRTWRLPQEVGDSHTGLIDGTLGIPVQQCWHISRPGESAAEAVPWLKRLYPPTGPGSTGADMVYGGYETWPSEAAGTPVLIGVSWPMQVRPDQGSSMLYVITARHGGTAPLEPRP